jgi:hypothetical protein
LVFVAVFGIVGVVVFAFKLRLDHLGPGTRNVTRAPRLPNSDLNQGASNDGDGQHEEEEEEEDDAAAGSSSGQPGLACLGNLRSGR